MCSELLEVENGDVVALGGSTRTVLYTFLALRGSHF